MIIQTLIKWLRITQSRRLQVPVPSYVYIYKTRLAFTPLRVLTTIMPLIRERAAWCMILIMLGGPAPLVKPKLNFSCPLQQLWLLMSYMFGFCSLCKWSLSINFRFISICHRMHSNRRRLSHPHAPHTKIWLKPISIIYTGQGTEIKLDGLFRYCRVNYMTFNKC